MTMSVSVMRRLVIVLFSTADVTLTLSAAGRNASNQRDNDNRAETQNPTTTQTRAVVVCPKKEGQRLLERSF